MGQGTSRVTRNRPSDVWTNLVPIVGYQSSSKISTWSTQADRSFVMHWMFTEKLFIWSSSSVTVKLWSGKLISKILDRDRSTSAQIPSCLILNLFKSFRNGEFEQFNEISLNLNINRSLTYNSKPVCQSFQWILFVTDAWKFQRLVYLLWFCCISTYVIDILSNFSNLIVGKHSDHQTWPKSRRKIWN